MAEQKKARTLKQRGNFGNVGSSARASRNAFKEKLESNSPAYVQKLLKFFKWYGGGGGGGWSFD